MRSLAHNTWRGRGACWSSKMGLGRIDKLIHSHGPAHNPHKVVSAKLEHLWCQDSHGQHGHTKLTTARTWGKPPPSLLQYSLQRSAETTSKWLFFPGLSAGSPEIPPCGTLGTLEPHNFASRPRIEMRSKTKLQLSSRAFQRYVARCLKLSTLGRFLTFSGRESKLADSREFDSRPFFWS